MRLKVYQAPNIGAAMAMVRTELGPDALILATRPADGGVEVTAALEQPQPQLAPADPAREAALSWHGVPEALRARLIRGDFATALAAEFSFETVPLAPGTPPLLFLGPSGTGKTLTVARLATRLVLAGQKPLVVTADGRRAGAAEQLAAFTRLLGLTLVAADEPLTLARALSRRTEGAPVLIDTPGLNWNDSAERETAEMLIAATAGTAALVLPTGLDPAEAAEIADASVELGASLLIATRLDQSRRLGGILAAAAKGLALAEAGIGPGAADGLVPFTPGLLAERLGASQRPQTPQPLPRPLPPYIRPRDGQPRPM